MWQAIIGWTVIVLWMALALYIGVTNKYPWE